jgi:hypothetical protein
VYVDETHACEFCGGLFVGVISTKRIRAPLPYSPADFKFEDVVVHAAGRCRKALKIGAYAVVSTGRHSLFGFYVIHWPSGLHVMSADGITECIALAWVFAEMAPLDDWCGGDLRPEHRALARKANAAFEEMRKAAYKFVGGR